MGEDLSIGVLLTITMSILASLIGSIMCLQQLAYNYSNQLVTTLTERLTPADSQSLRSVDYRTTGCCFSPAVLYAALLPVEDYCYDICLSVNGLVYHGIDSLIQFFQYKDFYLQYSESNGTYYVYITNSKPV